MNNDYAHEYTLGLALFDFVPVALSAIALIALARWMQGRSAFKKPAWVGALLAISGGVSKAVWKLVVVTTGTDITALDNALFPLLGAGFTLLLVTLALLKLRRPQLIWPVSIAGIVTVLAIAFVPADAEGAQRWQTVLLILTAASSTVLFVWLAIILLVRRNWLAGLAIIASVAGTFYLTRLARVPEQTLRVQWTAELVNTASQFAFLLGVIILVRTRLFVETRT